MRKAESLKQELQLKLGYWDYALGSNLNFRFPEEFQGILSSAFIEQGIGDG